MRRNDSGELLDKNGLTEREFLAAYRADRYPRPSVTADIMLLSETADGVETLLIRRGGHPYLGCWALPGGFADPSERVEQAAARELEEETHVADLPLYPLMLCSAPGRDPRGWTISQAYLALVRRAELPVQADDDAAEACWFSLARAGRAAGCDALAPKWRRAEPYGAPACRGAAHALWRRLGYHRDRPGRRRVRPCRHPAARPAGL